MTDYQKARLAEKLARLAYELEYDAARLREAGLDSSAETIREAAASIGSVGRNM